MMSPLPALLATIDVNSTMTFWQNLNYQLVGVAIVLFSLGFLALAVFVVGKLIHSSVQAAQKTVLVPPPAVEPMPSLTPAKTDAKAIEEPGISREIRAVIAAAVYVSLKGAHRIIEINPVTSAQTQAWSMEGRRQIFQSHRVR
jgi:Na+-transporting methylmalonyl-CoA/oxaloacetate decarboxylase gamma subunit